MNLARQFEVVLPQLARPLPSLERVSRFAESYTARKFFFKTCAENPRFFCSLCLLLDRSQFTTQLLCQHPEIMEEVLVIQNRRHKSPDRLLKELGELPGGAEFPRWLWLYVKAEQVRLSILQLTGDCRVDELEQSLTLLADTALHYTLRKIDPQERLAIIGLGKFGAQEMTLGSDLDLLILTDEKNDASAVKTAQKLLAILGHRHPLGPTFEIDLRLRPHGRGGPLLTPLKAFAKYHQKSARTWEKQLLTRSRFIAGNEQMARGFVELRHQLLFSAPLKKEEWSEILKMKTRLEKTKIPPDNPFRAFKKDPGGLIGIEFARQMAVLKYGGENPELNLANTRKVLKKLPELCLQESGQNLILQKNYEALRTVELNIRRETNKAADTLSKKPETQEALAKWMGFKDREVFWDQHQKGMVANKKIVKILINEIISAH